MIINNRCFKLTHIGKSCIHSCAVMNLLRYILATQRSPISMLHVNHGPGAPKTTFSQLLLANSRVQRVQSNYNCNPTNKRCHGPFYNTLARQLCFGSQKLFADGNCTRTPLVSLAAIASPRVANSMFCTPRRAHSMRWGNFGGVYFRKNVCVRRAKKAP